MGSFNHSNYGLTVNYEAATSGATRRGRRRATNTTLLNETQHVSDMFNDMDDSLFCESLKTSFHSEHLMDFFIC